MLFLPTLIDVYIPPELIYESGRWQVTTTITGKLEALVSASSHRVLCPIQVEMENFEGIRGYTGGRIDEKTKVAFDRWHIEKRQQLNLLPDDGQQVEVETNGAEKWRSASFSGSLRDNWNIFQINSTLPTARPKAANILAGNRDMGMNISSKTLSVHTFLDKTSFVWGMIDREKLRKLRYHRLNSLPDFISIILYKRLHHGKWV